MMTEQMQNEKKVIDENVLLRSKTYGFFSKQKPSEFCKEKNAGFESQTSVLFQYRALEKC
jgi:hypothetical protein